jgi:hypothetical protein
MAFYEVGKVYRLAGYDHTIHAVVETLYGPLAFATFPRSNGLDVQTLCLVQYQESQLVKVADVCE